jgi:hypothetical protein
VIFLIVLTLIGMKIIGKHHTWIAVRDIEAGRLLTIDLRPLRSGMREGLLLIAVMTHDWRC